MVTGSSPPAGHTGGASGNVRDAALMLDTKDPYIKDLQQKVNTDPAGCLTLGSIRIRDITQSRVTSLELAVCLLFLHPPVFVPPCICKHSCKTS